ncbi:MAG: glycosyltransferase family 2 protein [Pirellulaceae bacterium]|nr:glycosyltransferase family 2 protein [Pirellulaceae bacterium]
MNHPLSIIVPVRNAESFLADQVAHLLDVLPDLTSKFEIVVIDDASSDQTVELVRELACQYPQLRLICHRQPQGSAAAIRTGMQWAQSKTVFVVEDSSFPSPTDLRRLWSLRDDEQLVMARADGRPGVVDPGLLERLSTWGQALRNFAQGSAAAGIQMIRRDAAEQIPAGHADDAALSVVSLPPTAERARADQSHPAGRPRVAATFLGHLRDLALGE